MKKILIPIAFSDTSKNALIVAHAIARQFDAKLSLLHCYPAQAYNREYNFGKIDYDEGIRKMMMDFYTESIETDGHIDYKLLTFSGAVSDIVSRLSGQFEMLVMSRKTGFKSHMNNLFSDKLMYIASKAVCPVLITSTEQHYFSFQKTENIWHLNRNENETDIVKKKMRELEVDPKGIVVKSLQQNTFVSSFWKNIINYSKNHDKGLLQEISRSFNDEKIDLLILVNQRKGLFENFIKNEVFQIISQFNIPILILQNNT